jgi:CRISPR-associated protein Cas1
MRPPSFERYLLTLRLTAPARFHFLHGGVLRGLLSAALGQHELPVGVVPFAPEAGRARFDTGEAYRLGLTLVGPESASAEKILAGLERVGREKPNAEGASPTLGGNFRLEAAAPLAPADLDAETDALLPCAGPGNSLTLRFLSPLRLERPEGLQERGATFLNEECFPIPHFLERLWARLFRFAHGRFPTVEEQNGLPPLPAGLVAEPGHLPWLDLPVTGGARKKPYTLGGVVGAVRLSGVPEEWLPLLVLGRHLHAGAGTSYGFGRYRIEETAPGFPEAFLPAASVLELAARREVLAEALDHVVEQSEAPGEDGVTPQEVAAASAYRLGEIARDLAAGRLRPSPLSGFLQPKDDGGVRPLAVPTVRDRVAQRAVAQVLAPALDTLLEDSSYAYRKGFSRAGAARAVERAYADGYRFVLDADIEAFFDNVPWKRLFEKLGALFPLDPPLLDLLAGWVRAPVVFDGRTIDRTRFRRGLPQGAAISPLLANLYLDELDEELTREGFRLVRYADDFVVLARDVVEARRAREVAQEALAGLGLTLNPDDTALRSIDMGFSYLGYLFVRSLVLEQPPKEPSALPKLLLPEDIPAASWLAQVPLRRLREVVAEGRGGRRRRQVRLVPLAAAAPGSLPATRPLYVTSPDARLHLDRGSLVIERGDAEPRRVPLHGISHAVFLGPSRLTVPLLVSLAEAGVPSFFCHRSGELRAVFSPQGSADWTLWMAQARHAEDETARLRFAREVVAAKLHNQATLATRFRWQGHDELAPSLRDLEQRTANPDSLEGLLGLEGRGAALYFAALAASLPEGWAFRGRKRHPAPDPVNALLSFGYTLLHHHLASALTAAGLNPRIGLLHRERGTHCALASDLQEEMRWLIEAEVWDQLSRGRVKPEDFTLPTSGSGPCWITHDLRHRFVADVEGRLNSDFTPPGREEPTTYRQFIAEQARQVAQLVRGERSLYQPLRLHA